MHDTRAGIVARARRVLQDRIRPAEHTIIDTVRLSRWELDGGTAEPVPIEDVVGPRARAEVHFEPIAVGTPWGPPWGTTWFHLEGSAPAGHETLELIVDLGWNTSSPGFQAEALVLRPDGSVVKGLNPQTMWIPVDGDSPIDLYLEAAANPTIFDLGGRVFTPTPLGDRSTAGTAPRYVVRRADLVSVSRDVRELIADLEFLLDLTEQLEPSESRAWRILAAVERARDVLDARDILASAASARAELAPVLTSPAAASSHRVSAIGHAHIDTAWLWPTRETKRKVARTLANVMQLMEHDPDLVFAMSSAQQWSWLQESHPRLFERALSHVATGRIVPVGGMWVESDTAMVGSEAMVRQIVRGTRYFERETGTRSTIVWLPDTFGFSGALPQIFRLAGFTGFLSQKMSWNDSNPFPHHTFTWVGIDGSSIFSHFPPVDSYHSDLSPRELLHASRNFRDKAGATMSVVPFGHGDGGGGPTREMLARGRRARDLEGVPRVTIESPEAFLERARAEYATAPTWHGELYLELHRGIYTSQHAMKAGNRRTESLVRSAELWATTATVRTGAAYPSAALDDAWRTILLHQFHDILPGSSISWVHREAREEYARVERSLQEVIEEARAALGAEAAVGATRVGVEPAVESVAGGLRIATGAVTVGIDARGLVTSVVTEDGREHVANGQAFGLLQLHDDKPAIWDAWDIDRSYRRVGTDLDVAASLSWERADDGSVTVIAVREFGESRAAQRLTLRAGSAELDWTTEVDWHERETLLKLAFTADVHVDRARFETQFGYHSRPVADNTTWDAARYEVPGHRWVHVGEPRGVAIANDSTYGHEVRTVARSGGGAAIVLRESLLRAPLYPDPETDQGTHVFRHVVLPGADVADAIRLGRSVNAIVEDPADAPIRVAEGSSILVETVKLAEDGSGDVVVRLYESQGRPARDRLVLDIPAAGIHEVDLHERPIEDLGLGDDPALDGVELSLRPFQIVTLRIRRA